MNGTIFLEPFFSCLVWVFVVKNQLNQPGKHQEQRHEG